LGAGVSMRVNKMDDLAKYAAKHRALCGPCADNSYYAFCFFQAAGDPINSFEYAKEYLHHVDTDRNRPIWNCSTFEMWDEVMLRSELIDYWLHNETRIAKPKQEHELIMP
jgi:hypothetical protein